MDHNLKLPLDSGGFANFEGKHGWPHWQWNQVDLRRLRDFPAGVFCLKAHALWTEYSKNGVVKLMAIVNGVHRILPLPIGHGTQVRLRHQQASDGAEEYLQVFF